MCNITRQLLHPESIVVVVSNNIHKPGAPSLDIQKETALSEAFNRLIHLEGGKGVMVQPMLKGPELFVGATYEERFGHLVLYGLGGIYVEVLQDVATGLCPLSYREVLCMMAVGSA